MSTASPELRIDPWSDLLGGMVERFPRLCITLGNWESRLLGDTLSEVAIDRPIFIAGLARSGSTILLELLSKHPETATHRYRDFPLLHLPWTWNWFIDHAGRAEQQAVERAHRDRIKVTADSPEAFEEVLWMSFIPDLHDPSVSSVLGRGERHPRFEAFYREHIRKLLLIRGASRYLSKGNYNVTRLGYLQSLFPDARFLVPIRDPLWHIASLMKQHRLFCSASREEPRVARHLRRSGHFEFGPDRRVINTGDATAAESVERLWRYGAEVEGWAEYWSLVYGHVADVLQDPEIAAAAQVVRYEEFCARPEATMTDILRHCDLAAEALPEEAGRTISPPGYYQPEFTPAEYAAIRERTADTAARFGYA